MTQGLEREVDAVDLDLREGRFQRALSLIAGLSSAVAGAEVTYEHYKGSYSRRIMYTPVMLSAALALAGVAGFFSKRAAKTVLPAVSAITLADAAVGFYFHVRGIARKPGGWRLPIVNMVMGPPVFAPLLFGVSAYLGMTASFMRRGERDDATLPRPARADHWANALPGEHEPIGQEQDAREAHFQRHMATAAAIAAFLSGFEAAYSHYKNNFRYSVQWTPLIITPMLMGSAIGALKSARIAHTWLPAMSALAMLDGGVGFAYHVRGVLRRPGGSKKLLYNIVYGPPIFAPLLFAASGFLGLLASVLRKGEDVVKDRDGMDMRPVDPNTGGRIGPLEQPGYYPGFRTLDQRKFWDAATREVVLDRVNTIPKIRFFTAQEARLLEAVCSRVLPQDDRDEARKIPIVPQIDKRLYENVSDGYRYEDMPPDREAFRLGLQAIDEIAQAEHGKPFVDIHAREQETILRSLHDAKPRAAHEIWARMPVHRFWMLLVKECAENYYAHPWAWDEIGFGGPAYPRAYMRLERGEPEPWEVQEQRYAWEAPPDSQSHLFEPIAGQEEHFASPGQGGTH